MAMSDADHQIARTLDSLDSLAHASGHVGDVDDLLHEVLGQLVSIVEADTATVLLIDDLGTHLTARATHGIEEEVRQGVRVPVGAGFAGRIAAERRPIALDQVDGDTVANPILWQKGIQRMVGVPLEAGTTMMGVLHLGRIAARSFTAEDTALLELVAARIAAAVQTRQLEVERAASKVLQRSLLPSALPVCPGLEFATRFVPAEVGGVGGDWYDAFVLPSGVLWVMVGDVAGHGLAAAVSMGRLRAALRSYALEGHTPERVLALGGQKLKFFDEGQMATVLIAVLPPPFDRVTIASAGHLPPVLALSDGTASFVHPPISPPLGALKTEPDSITVDLPRGAVLLAYTDGLVERRRELLDIGLERLRAAVTAGAPEAVCQQVMERSIGDTLPNDDIAVLALRRTA